MDDDVTQPDHYRRTGGIEPLEFIAKNGLDFCEGSIVKYIFRYKEKDGLKCLLKARFFLDQLISREKDILKDLKEEELSDDD